MPPGQKAAFYQKRPCIHDRGRDFNLLSRTTVFHNDDIGGRVGLHWQIETCPVIGRCVAAVLGAMYLKTINTGNQYLRALEVVVHLEARRVGTFLDDAFVGYTGLCTASAS